MTRKGTSISELISQDREGVLDAWVARQLASDARRSDLTDEAQVREQSARILDLLVATADEPEGDITGSAFSELRGAIDQFSEERLGQGYSPAETATFVFSLKQVLFERLADGDAAGMQSAWHISTVLDSVGLYTIEAYNSTRERVIQRQRDELFDVSTPVVKVWDGILALPVIGTLDSARTQQVMENLLQQIVSCSATVAILDITGVAVVDTLVAQHLLKTVAAARMMGARCIISGISPEVAQTIVHLGIELGDVSTKSTLADALKLAFELRDCRVICGSGVER